jgi:hypothetical protein
MELRRDTYRIDQTWKTDQEGYRDKGRVEELFHLLQDALVQIGQHFCDNDTQESWSGPMDTPNIRNDLEMMAYQLDAIHSVAKDVRNHHLGPKGQHLLKRGIETLWQASEAMFEAAELADEGWKAKLAARSKAPTSPVPHDDSEAPVPVVNAPAVAPVDLIDIAAALAGIQAKLTDLTTDVGTYVAAGVRVFKHVETAGAHQAAKQADALQKTVMGILDTAIALSPATSSNINRNS